jgi:hypothetical protein
VVIVVRSVPVQYGVIQISSVAGERRRIRVSGLARARLLWLFRNFSILDFPVLTKQQQQLISQMWQAGAIAGSRGASLDLIGSIEGFRPQLCQAAVATAKSRPQGARIALPNGLRLPVGWTVVGALLLGCAIYPWPKHRSMPQPGAVAVAAPERTQPEVPALARVSAGPAPSIPATPAAATESSSLPPAQLPGAMARDESALPVMPPHPRAAVAEAPAKPEVIVRVSVDGEGQAQTFQILQGDRKKIPAALAAAKRWHFQPCSDSAACEHSLKITDYGDASSVQMID